MVKNLPVMQETWVQSLGREDPLEKKMATHSSILAWRVPWREEPGELWSMESQRVKTLLIYFWLYWGLCCFKGFLLLGRVVGHGLLCSGFSCGAQALGCVSFRGCGTRAYLLWCMGLAAPWHVGSFQIRDCTCVSCIGGRILYH